MRILHTSDWHLGRRLCDRERKEEFGRFLGWLTETLVSEEIDALVVSGDVFDSFTPPQWALALYYDFLTNLALTPCRSAVIVAGNHDSPALLDAPRGLLIRSGVHVVGFPKLENEVFELSCENGGAVCCAVPFLRSRDLCGAMEGLTSDERRGVEQDAFAEHYRAAVEEAQRLRGGREVPLIATGHAFAAGGRVIDGDGTRDLSVGSLDIVPLSAFTREADYLALGHLHSPQRCGGAENARYSGAPLVLSFAEAGTRREVCVVDFDGRVSRVRTLAVPAWRDIRRLRGTFDELARELETLQSSENEIWAEAECADESGELLNERLRALAPDDGPVRLLRVRAKTDTFAQTLSGEGDLNEDWSPEEVFGQYLKDHQIEGESARELMAAYREAVAAAREELDETAQTHA